MVTFFMFVPFGVTQGVSFVCGFFLISGFVLSYRFWQNKESSRLTVAAMRRYVRLTGPALASILIFYILLKNNLIFNREICEFTEHMKYVPMAFNLIPNFGNALYEGLWGMYFSYDLFSSYNFVLWTMEYEFKGSIMALAFLALFGKVKNRAWIYIFFFAVTFKTFYVNFLFGIIAADFIYSEEGKKYFAKLQGKNFLSVFFLIAGCFFSYYSSDATLEIYHKMNFEFFGKFGIDSDMFYHALGAIFFVYSVMLSNFLKKFFSLKIFTTLGKYSYSLYLFHCSTLFSVGGIIFLKLHQAGADLKICILAGSLSAMLATVPIIIFSHHFFDIPSGKFSKYLQTKFLE